MRSIHARMPPWTFHAFANPASRIAMTAFALRAPERQ
jgi:hypothetical protein